MNRPAPPALLRSAPALAPFTIHKYFCLPCTGDIAGSAKARHDDHNRTHMPAAAGTVRAQAVGGKLNIEVRHAALVVPSEQGAAPWEDDQELIRTIYFGEALRAVQTYVSEALLSGPPEPMLDLLGEAFDRLRDARREFTPEEFTTYYMSMLLDLCQDADEARRLRSGAMRYMLASAAALPPDFSALVEDARRLLVAEGGMPVETADARSASSHRLASLLAQARVRQADRKAPEIPIVGLVSSPPQESGEASGPEGQRTRSGPSLRQQRELSPASGSGRLLATLGALVLLVCLSLIATGVIEPVIVTDLNAW